MAKRNIERPFNNKTMSSAAFFGMIRSSLRQSSRWWKPIHACKQKAKRAYKGANKRQKFEYKCAECKKYFADKETVIDHIIPAGTLRSFADLPAFCERLFVEMEGLQCLCKDCHQIKTNLERITNKTENE